MFKTSILVGLFSMFLFSTVSFACDCNKDKDAATTTDAQPKTLDNTENKTPAN